MKILFFFLIISNCIETTKCIREINEFETEWEDITESKNSKLKTKKQIHNKLLKE